jgi:hypothetical protein
VFERFARKTVALDGIGGSPTRPLFFDANWERVAA